MTVSHKYYDVQNTGKEIQSYREQLRKEKKAVVDENKGVNIGLEEAPARNEIASPDTEQRKEDLIPAADIESPVKHQSTNEIDGQDKHNPEDSTQK